MTQDSDDKIIAAALAARLWADMTANEHGMIRFGIFPAEKMRTGEAELIRAGVDPRDVVRRLAVALMDCAKADGGMRA